MGFRHYYHYDRKPRAQDVQKAFNELQGFVMPCIKAHGLELNPVGFGFREVFFGFPEESLWGQFYVNLNKRRYEFEFKSVQLKMDFAVKLFLLSLANNIPGFKVASDADARYWNNSIELYKTINPDFSENLQDFIKTLK